MVVRRKTVSLHACFSNTISQSGKLFQEESDLHSFEDESHDVSLKRVCDGRIIETSSHADGDLRPIRCYLCYRLRAGLQDLPRNGGSEP